MTARMSPYSEDVTLMNTTKLGVLILDIDGEKIVQNLPILKTHRSSHTTLGIVTILWLVSCRLTG